MVQYKQTSKNYFQKVKSDGTKVRVSKTEFMKYKSMKGGENEASVSRSNQNWEVHANALKNSKKMVAVAVFEKKGNGDRNVKQLAKNLENKLNLNKIGNKKRHPVWIQSTKKLGNTYYTVFLALNKNKNEFNEEKKEVVNIITNLGNKNVTTNKLLENIRNSTLNNTTTKKEVEDILNNVYTSYFYKNNFPPLSSSKTKLNTKSKQLNPEALEFKPAQKLTILPNAEIKYTNNPKEFELINNNKTMILYSKLPTTIRNGNKNVSVLTFSTNKNSNNVKYYANTTNLKKVYEIK